MLTTSLVAAEMRPIDDEELSEYVGQAAVAFDIDQIGTNSYTRVTLGLEADLQMNINNVELGNYSKSGETLAADFAATNLAFGSISTNASQVQLDGQTYAVNDIVPFELNDPFFEIAQNSSEELIGFRLGFGQARGQLSGDFTSMSGNIGADITDFFGDDYRSSLLDANGNADSSRAQYFGVTDKEALRAFQLCSKLEGIIPALEPSHALAYLVKAFKNKQKGKTVILNLCGRGDKDLFTAAKAIGFDADE